MKEMDLTKMRPQEIGIIKEIEGGEKFISKIQAVGIRPGKKIKKISSHFLRGPQTIEIDSMKVAVGFGMAKKIIVTVSR